MKQQRYSRQREEILKLLKKSKNHPTADWIYTTLKQQMPDLSLGTVYRNLSLLEQNGDIQKLTFGPSFHHYDGNPEPHCHFLCSCCGNIYDLMGHDFSHMIDQIRANTDFTVSGFRLEFYGICSPCKKRKELKH